MKKVPRRTTQIYLTTDRVELSFSMPLSEIVFDFYDRLKSITKGYASFDYEITGYEINNLVKVIKSKIKFLV